MENRRLKLISRKTVYVFTVLTVLVAPLSGISLEKVSSAVTCPYVDGGSGDGDGVSTPDNPSILINTNRSLTATLENEGEFNCSDSELIIATGVTLTLIPYNNGNTNYTDDFGVTLIVGSLTVQNGGTISSNGYGYAGGYGPGVGSPNTVGVGYEGSGAGHGGLGGNGWDAPGGLQYGSILYPTTFGSGGGDGRYSAAGSAGGGIINIVSSSDVTINGTLSVNGSPTSSRGGAGSGGSVLINSQGTVNGTGTVAAIGGFTAWGDSNNAGAGGGGRISILSQGTDNTLILDAAGGTNVSNPIYSGQRGTAIIYNTVNKSATIRTSQKWIPNSTSYFEDNLGEVDSLTITNNSTLELDSGNKSATDLSGYGWNIEVDSLIVDAGSSISSNALGHLITKGPGAGGVRVGWEGGGGGHGGKGGDAWGNTPGGITYGSALSPITIGSGGAYGQSTLTKTGKGGGAVKITSKQNLVINGTIEVNGEANSGEDGAGAGGSIWLITYGSFTGTGLLSANGGNSIGLGGSGGGGRISILSRLNQYTGALSISSGTHSNASYKGVDGTLSLTGIPSSPGNAVQKNVDSITVTAGSVMSSSTAQLSVDVSDPDSADTLFAEFEIKPIGQSFSDVATHTSSTVSYVNTPLTATVLVENLSDQASYHWQARACNSAGQCSLWTSYGDNEDGQPDFIVSLNRFPDLPVIPGSSPFINQQQSNDITPTFLFSQSDPDEDNQVQFTLELATMSDFSSPIIAYTSTLTAQGTASFTVGQAAGLGTYAVGNAGQTLPEGQYYWRVKTIDNSNGESDWSVASGTPAFSVDISAPTNVITTSAKAFFTHNTTHTDDSESIWFGRSDMYFSWNADGDTSGLKGYCVYIGLNPNGDPATEKGVLGTSPISTTGSNCEFIVDENQLDFANTALRSEEWLTTSNSPYYFKIRPIDMANNVGEEDTDSSTFSFYFDNTAPKNVTTISASSGSLSNIADMVFYWPVTGSQAASDVGSSILGYQYAVNSTEEWRGTETDPITGLAFIPTDYEQPFALDPAIVGDDIIVGSNVLYFRTIDVAGNASLFTTAPIEYGGEAPSFEDSDSVTVTPTTNTQNRFAFSWPEATPSEGRTIASYYYMINTPPPALFSTITSNSATYVPTSSRSIAATSLTNVRKGSNTIYVVAVDDAGNYSQSNYLVGNFTLNSSLPDAPQTIVVTDASIKSAELWRSTLAWGEPAYAGAGDLTYIIQRSEDGDNWSPLTTTKGKAFLDTLENSQQYFWRVGAMDSSDESIAAPSFANAVSLTPKGTFTEPAELTSGPASSSVTTKRATISWTTNRASDSKVAIGTQSGKYEKVESYDSSQTTDHSLPLINLKPGTEYFYVAKWTDEDGNTGISKEKTFKTAPPPSVKDIEVRNLGIDSALVKFTTIGASSATVRYGRNSEFGEKEMISTSALETTYAIQLSGLNDGTKHYFMVETTDSEGDSYEGSILSFNTLPRPKVSNITIQQVADSAQASIQVNWESNTAISSIVTFYPDSNPEHERDAVDIELVEGEHSMVIPGLIPETPYTLIVKGRDRIGNEAISETLKFTTATDTRPPLIYDLIVEGTNVSQSSSSGSQSTNSQLVISWTTDEPATSQIEYGDGTGVTYSQLSQEDSKLSHNHLVIVSGLTPSKVYHLRAISKDSAGNESKSIDTVTITPKAADNAFDLVITNLREVFGFLGE